MPTWTDVDFSKLNALSSFEEEESDTPVNLVSNADDSPIRIEPRPTPPAVHVPPPRPTAPPQETAPPQRFNAELTQPGLPARERIPI